MDLSNKTILITGAGGSIGNEITSFFSNNYIDLNLIAFDISENNLVLLKERLRDKRNIDYVIGDVRDELFLHELFKSNYIDIVIHCAAYKQVAFMQNNLYWLINNNLKGLMTLLNVIESYNVRKFLNISTDKAVYPSSHMGMTKRLGELLITSRNRKQKKTHLTSLRFGNIFYSSGSVLPIFEIQWKYFNKIFISDIKAKRFFINKNDLSKFIYQSLLQRDFDLVIGNYGEEKFIYDLAVSFLKEKKVENIDECISIQKLKQGEKISESLRYDFEIIHPLANYPDVYGIKSNNFYGESVEAFIDKIISENLLSNSNKIKYYLESEAYKYFN